MTLTVLKSTDWLFYSFVLSLGLSDFTGMEWSYTFYSMSLLPQLHLTRGNVPRTHAWERQDGAPISVPSVSFMNFSKADEAAHPPPPILVSQGRSVLGCPFHHASWRQVSAMWQHPERGAQDSIGQGLVPDRLQQLLALDLRVRLMTPHTPSYILQLCSLSLSTVTRVWSEAVHTLAEWLLCALM